MFGPRLYPYRIADSVPQRRKVVVSRQRVEGVVPQMERVLPLELGLVVKHVRVHPRQQDDTNWYFRLYLF